MDAEEFIKLAYRGSYRNPISKFEQFIVVGEDGSDVVAFELQGDEIPQYFKPFRGPVVAIVSLRSTKPKFGYGSAWMRGLTRLADTHGVALTLFAQTFGNNKIPQQKLVRFYKNHGFRLGALKKVRANQGNTMVRYPSGY
jgi:hypothetical protein